MVNAFLVLLAKRNLLRRVVFGLMNIHIVKDVEELLLFKVIQRNDRIKMNNSNNNNSSIMILIREEEKENISVND